MRCWVLRMLVTEHIAIQVFQHRSRERERERGGVKPGVWERSNSAPVGCLSSGLDMYQFDTLFFVPPQRRLGRLPLAVEKADRQVLWSGRLEGVKPGGRADRGLRPPQPCAP